MFSQIAQKYFQTAKRMKLLKLSDKQYMVENKSLKFYNNFKPLIFLFIGSAVLACSYNDNKYKKAQNLKICQQNDYQKFIHDYFGVIKVAEKFDVQLNQNS